METGKGNQLILVDVIVTFDSNAAEYILLRTGIVYLYLIPRILGAGGQPREKDESKVKKTSYVSVSTHKGAKIILLFHFSEPTVPSGIFLQRLMEFRFPEIRP